ncbi:MAG TPA: HAD family hydrolase, partial [Verrucomicrobiae bacterium]|nr:HAD family hydrolase [Verrucomicrobiae bacterium]
RARFPADHYVMVDDKIRILDAMKKQWRDRLTTVFVRQGHYATDAAVVARYPPADIAIGRIADLLDFNLEDLLNPGRGRRSQ